MVKMMMRKKMILIKNSKNDFDERDNKKEKEKK